MTVLTDTDDDLQTVVAEVEGLGVTLGSVTDDGEGVVLEDFVELLLGEVGTFPDGLLSAGEVEGFDTALLDGLFVSCLLG